MLFIQILYNVSILLSQIMFERTLLAIEKCSPNIFFLHNWNLPLNSSRYFITHILLGRTFLRLVIMVVHFACQFFFLELIWEWDKWKRESVCVLRRQTSFRFLVFSPNEHNVCDLAKVGNSKLRWVVRTYLNFDH